MSLEEEVEYLDTMSHVQMLQTIMGLIDRIKEGEIAALAYIVIDDEGAEMGFSPMSDSEYEEMMQGLDRLKFLLTGDDVPERLN